MRSYHYKRPSHTTTEITKKNRYRPYTLQLFFTTAKIFSTVLYMVKDFHNDFSKKIVVKIFVVCEGIAL